MNIERDIEAAWDRLLDKEVDEQFDENDSDGDERIPLHVLRRAAAAEVDL